MLTHVLRNRSVPFSERPGSIDIVNIYIYIYICREWLIMRHFLVNDGNIILRLRFFPYVSHIVCSLESRVYSL